MVKKSPKLTSSKIIHCKFIAAIATTNFSKERSILLQAMSYIVMSLNTVYSVPKICCKCVQSFCYVYQSLLLHKLLCTQPISTVTSPVMRNTLHLLASLFYFCTSSISTVQVNVCVRFFLPYLVLFSLTMSSIIVANCPNVANCMDQCITAIVAD